MRRRSKAAVVGVAIILAFIFLVPITQVGFVLAPVPNPCPTTTPESGSMSSCGIAYYLPGHASVTYWLFGVGATYGSVNNTGYGLGFAKCSTLAPPNFANTTKSTVFVRESTSVRLCCSLSKC
jgi:hypothetical protein